MYLIIVNFIFLCKLYVINIQKKKKENKTFKAAGKYELMPWFTPVEEQQTFCYLKSLSKNVQFIKLLFNILRYSFHLLNVSLIKVSNLSICNSVHANLHRPNDKKGNFCCICLWSFCGKGPLSTKIVLLSSIFEKQEQKPGRYIVFRIACILRLSCFCEI